MTLTVDRANLVELMDATFLHHSYRMGSKPRLGSSAGQWTRTDCSGYIRWLLHGCTKPAVKLPEGSVEQREWCEQHALKATSPSYKANGGLLDDILRIAFIRPTKRKAGHVWLVINGRTIESYGGHGPGRRPWDTKVLLKNVDGCYVLTGPLP